MYWQHVPSWHGQELKVPLNPELQYIHLISKHYGNLKMRMRGHTACIKQLATSPWLSFNLPWICRNPNSEHTGCRSGFHDAGDFLFRAGDEMKDMDGFASIRDIPGFIARCCFFLRIWRTSSFCWLATPCSTGPLGLISVWLQSCTSSLHPPGMMLMQMTQKKFSIRTEFSGIWSTSNCHDFVLFILFHWYLCAIFIRSFTYLLNVAVFFWLLRIICPFSSWQDQFLPSWAELEGQGTRRQILLRAMMSTVVQSMKARLGSGEDHGRKRIRVGCRFSSIYKWKSFMWVRFIHWLSSGNGISHVPSNSLQGKGSRDLHLWDVPNPVRWRNISLKPARTRTWREALLNSENKMPSKGLQPCWFNWCGDKGENAVVMWRLTRSGRDTLATPLMLQHISENLCFGLLCRLGLHVLQFMSTPFEWRLRSRLSQFPKWPLQCASISFHHGCEIASKSFKRRFLMKQIPSARTKNRRFLKNQVTWHYRKDPARIL